MRLKSSGETSARAPLTTTKVDPQIATTVTRRTCARGERDPELDPELDAGVVAPDMGEE
jgi:hypothetical protein